MHPIIKNCSLVVLCTISFLASWQIVSVDIPVYHGVEACKANIASQSASSNQATKSAELGKTNCIAIVDCVSSQFPQSSHHLSQGITNGLGLKKGWAFKQIQTQVVSQFTTVNSPIIVAVLDTGIDRDHEALNDRIIEEINFTQSETTDDIYGHGTHVAGIIAGKNNDGLSTIGIAPNSRLLNVKVADDKGRCEVSALVDGIIWAVENGANIINISIDTSESASGLRDAVDYAWRKGVVIVAAAGNDGSELPVYPAYYDNSIAVAAIQETGTLAPLSNYGNWVDVAAPGFNIYSTLPNNCYGYKHGTSFATAYVSGLAALLFPLVTDMNGNGRLNDEVRQAIEAGCREIGVEGTGKG